MNYFPEETKLSINTIKIYNRHINKWISFLPEHTNKLHVLLYSPAACLKILKRSLPPSSITHTNLHHYISAVTAIFKHSPSLITDLPSKSILQDIWEKLTKANYEAVIKRAQQQLPTKIQMQKDGHKLTLKDIEKTRDSLPDCSIEKLLLSMYTYIPPVRADYFATEIIKQGDKPSQPNYIVLSDDNAQIILHDFKTKRTYNEIRHDSVPKELHFQIAESLKKFPRKYLFVSPEGNLFTRATFSNWASTFLQKILGVKFTITFFRHLRCSTTDFSDSTENIKKISDAMGHSVATHKMYQWNLDSDSDSDSDSKRSHWTDDDKNTLLELVNLNPLNIDWDCIAADLDRTTLAVKTMYHKMVPVYQHISNCISSSDKSSIQSILKGIQNSCPRCNIISFDSPKSWKGIEYCYDCYTILSSEEVCFTWNSLTSIIKSRGFTSCTFCKKPYEFYSPTNRFHFDHIDMFDKTSSICDMVRSGESLDAILKEVEKCQLVCSSCHVAITAIERRFGFMRLKREETDSIISYKGAFEPVYAILKGLLGKS